LWVFFRALCIYACNFFVVAFVAFRASLLLLHRTHKCIAFHSGLPFYNPDEADSRSYCRDTRFGMVGALLTFVCMHALIYASARVFVANQERPSLVVVGGLGIPPEDGDPFSFNAGDQDFSGYNSPASSGNSNGRPNEPAPRNTPI